MHVIKNQFFYVDKKVLDKAHAIKLLFLHELNASTKMIKICQ